jgi:hypothetical protein
MIEYAKVILPSVCFWEDLFKKELLKCKNWAGNNELNELISWCYNTFGEMHPDILDETFAGTTCKIRNYKKAPFSVKPYKVHKKHRKIVEAA